MRPTSAAVAAVLVSAILANPDYDKSWGQPSRTPWGDGNISIGFGDGLYVKNGGDNVAAQMQARGQVIASAVYLEAVQATEEHFKLEPGTLQLSHYYYDPKDKVNKPRFQVTILKNKLMGEVTGEPRATVGERLSAATEQLMAKLPDGALAVLQLTVGMNEGVALGIIEAKLKSLAPETETPSGESDSDIPF